MAGLIGKKIGMTSIFDGDGKSVPCTVIEAGPCVVTEVRTPEKNKYSAIQLGFGEKKDKHTTAALKGHFAKAGTKPMKKLVEFRDFGTDYKTGDVIKADLFTEGEFVDVVGTSKGHGFQGVVKRHGFSGVGWQTHGQHDRQRAPGSRGASSFPARVLKGMRTSGHMGVDRVKSQNLKIVKVMLEHNLILVRGSVPGANGSFVIIEK